MKKTLREYKLGRIEMVSVVFWLSSRVHGKSVVPLTYHNFRIVLVSFKKKKNIKY